MKWKKTVPRTARRGTWPVHSSKLLGFEGPAVTGRKPAGWKAAPQTTVVSAVGFTAQEPTAEPS